MREKENVELEEGEIPPSPNVEKKKLGDQVNVCADFFEAEDRKVDKGDDMEECEKVMEEEKKKIDRKGKRKLEEYYDDQENLDDDYCYDNKKQKKAVVKGNMNNKKAGKGAVNRIKERAEEPLMPEGMRDNILKVMKGKNIKWVNTKEIFKSDTDRAQNCLYMPREVKELLRIEELNAVNKRIPFSVHVLGPRDDVWKLNFNYWGKVGKYVLITLWHQFVKEHKLEMGWKFVEI
ncbi:hypothetical protein IFM89_026057 [Coptis chinensis]|uniref:TF-B3 domain-containing protein n=1 Tax=Coptis chinensis TaxID=261450 RepID=A0A835ICW3_9MAGN|nr:hypothetical protein IFM89_026057 [Coptis chinensis]